MSASEILFFVRYFGILVGDKVHPETQVWQLYLKLREIVDIITSPKITMSKIKKLEDLIKVHHDLFKEFFGDLKAKFHIMIHYLRILIQNGPLIYFWSMRFESKHREFKKVFVSTSCKINILKTIDIRHQLGLISFNYLNYNDQEIVFGSEIKNIPIETRAFLANCSDYKIFSSVTINDETYRRGSVIVIANDSRGPTFEIIENVCCVINKIFFICVPYYLVGKDEHTYSYCVLPDHNPSNKQIIEYDLLPTKVQSLLFTENNEYLIVCRYSC